MKGKILVTDSLFIFDEHIKQLEVAGFEIERLDKATATEEELCKAIKGKVGYVLGGIEKVTQKVIDAADELKVIAFTGADWRALITGCEKATEKGIAITNAPGGNAYAVAEFALATGLAMQRNLFELGRTGDKTFQTAQSFKDATIGVVGTGKIGGKIIASLKGFSPKKIVYYSRTQKDNAADFVDFDELLMVSDVIFVAVPGSAGELFNAEAIARIKEGALLVSISPMNVINFDALLSRLKTGSLRAAIDWPAPSGEFKKLPLSVYYGSNSHTAYNTYQALKECSDMATQSIINLLNTGKDKYKVN
ncbi:MAG TPA: NAD(P)-dependent oxidoreductase [Candidatus Saccharimonadales bacterium]|nr:NAD(P)-dependent oxidoreductase [Candidatus Saccharimonadales bacterium]